MAKDAQAAHARDELGILNSPRHILLGRFDVREHLPSARPCLVDGGRGTCPQHCAVCFPRHTRLSRLARCRRSESRPATAARDVLGALAMAVTAGLGALSGVAV